LTKINLII